MGIFEGEPSSSDTNPQECPGSGDCDEQLSRRFFDIVRSIWMGRESFRAVGR